MGRSTTAKRALLVLAVLCVSCARVNGARGRKRSIFEDYGFSPSAVSTGSTTTTSTSSSSSTSTSSSFGRTHSSISVSTAAASNCNSSSTVEAPASSSAPTIDDIEIREQSIGGGGPPTLDFQAPAEAPQYFQEEFECEEDEFSFLEEEGKEVCRKCDDRCLPERCIDDEGCVGCEEGYYSMRLDAESPFGCSRCEISHCLDCQDGATGEEQVVKCLRCEEGFKLTIDAHQCVPMPSPSTPLVPIPSHKVEMSVPTAKTHCPLSYFLFGAAKECIKCDMHSAPGGCQDFVGCLGCMPGFFRRRSSLHGPFVCYPCTIADCAICEDDIDLSRPAVCRACDDGFRVDRRTGLCIPLY